jgi:DNA-directed RNA polymerase subunit alpha
VVKLHDSEPVTLTLRAEKEGPVTAGLFELPPNVDIINPDLQLATLAKGGKLVMEVRVEPGIGYVPAEVHNTKDRINSIPVDAIFTPVRRVAYRVEDTRVGQRTDLDKLVLRIWTDGSVSPREALDQSVDILRTQLGVFSSGVESIIEETKPVAVTPVKIKEEPVVAESQISLESLDLSSRVLHSLQEEGIDSVNALLALSKRDLKKVGGIGETSLDEIDESLSKKGLGLKE